MRQTRWVRLVLFFVSSFLFLCDLPHTHFAFADENKIMIIEETGAGKIIKIPNIGIKKAFFHSNKNGITIIEVDKLGPLRWILINTRIISITQYGHKIFLNDTVNDTTNIFWITWLELIKHGDEIFIQFLPPSETDETKQETREVDIRFSFYLQPDFTDYSEHSAK